MQMSLAIHEQFGTSTSKESESMKRMLIDTNPYLLAVTFTVSLLHSVFDLLAFKNGADLFLCANS
jgi:hypothetical protein